MDTIPAPQTFTTRSGTIWQLTPSAGTAATTVASWPAGSDPDRDLPREQFDVRSIEWIDHGVDQVRVHFVTEGVTFSDPFRRPLPPGAYVLTSPADRAAVPPAAHPTLVPIEPVPA